MVCILKKQDITRRPGIPCLDKIGFSFLFKYTNIQLINDKTVHPDPDQNERKPRHWFGCGILFGLITGVYTYSPKNDIFPHTFFSSRNDFFPVQ